MGYRNIMTKAQPPTNGCGISRDVCPQKVLREFENLSPVRALVFPRPNAKPPTVGCKLNEVERNNEK